MVSKKRVFGKDLFFRVLKGFGIGMAAIIPGFSGGTLAVVLDIYDEIIYAISDIRKDFKHSMGVLLPILLGALLAVCTLVIPLKLAFEYFPLPTVSLFVGFVIGGLPALSKKLEKQFSFSGLGIGLASIALAVGLCFIPGLGSVSFENMKVPGYFLLILMGAIGSFALVVPGISGSMILLILGYWEPIRASIEGLLKFTNIGLNIGVLCLFALGVVAGLILISKLMKFLLKKYTVLTYYGIIGFILGSIFSIYYTMEKIIINPLQISLAVVLMIAGIAASLFLEHYGAKKSKLQKNLAICDAENNSVESDSQSEAISADDENIESDNQ